MQLNKATQQEEKGLKYAKESETHQLPLLWVSQKYQTNNNNTYTEEDLVQTHEAPVLATPVSVSPCEPYLVDLVGHVLPVSFILSLSSMGLPNLQLKGQMETSSLDSFST